MLIINSIMRNNYKLDNQQETFLKGSSETTRRTTFNIDKLCWLIGFLEGDGSFIKSNDRYFFILTQNELIVLYKIKKFLGFGRVQKHGKYFRYIITVKKDLFYFINLILPFILFNKVILRIKNCINILFFEKFNINNFNFFKNGWLSGFIDSEGCFYIRLVKRLGYVCNYQIRICFFLDQNLLKEDMLIFNHLQSQLGGYILDRKNDNFRLCLEDDNRINCLINYLKRYPLKSHKKSIQYKHWLKCLNIKRKDKIEQKDIDKIKKIKSWRYSPPIYENI